MHIIHMPLSLKYHTIIITDIPQKSGYFQLPKFCNHFQLKKVLQPSKLFLTNSTTSPVLLLLKFQELFHAGINLHRSVFVKGQKVVATFCREFFRKKKAGDTQRDVSEYGFLNICFNIEMTKDYYTTLILFHFTPFFFTEKQVVKLHQLLNQFSTLLSDSSFRGLPTPNSPSHSGLLLHHILGLLRTFVFR